MAGLVSKEYRRFVSGLPCVACGAEPPNDPHHLIGHGRLKTGGKVDDLHCLPLCRMCHRRLHDIGFVHWETIHGSQWKWVARTLMRYVIQHGGLAS